MIGPSKFVPDERLVRVHEELVVPPDLLLRAPPDEATIAAAKEGELEALRAQADRLSARLAEESSDDSLEASLRVEPPEPTPDDLYSQYGIAPRRADGTLKTESEKLSELKRRYRGGEGVEDGDETFGYEGGESGATFAKKEDTGALGGLLGDFKAFDGIDLGGWFD